MKRLLATLGLWLALTTGALATCPVGWTGLGSCDTLLNKLTNADVNAALSVAVYSIGVLLARSFGRDRETQSCSEM